MELLRLKLFSLLLVQVFILETSATSPIHYSHCTDPFDISFVVENSNLVGNDGFTNAKRFIESLLMSFEISQAKTRVSLITYGRHAQSYDAIGLNDHSNIQSFVNSMNEIQYQPGNNIHGRTGIHEAIRAMVHEQKTHGRCEVNGVAIVIASGSFQNEEQAANARQFAEKHGIAIYAIGVGTPITLRELTSIADTRTNVFSVPNYASLQSIVDPVRTRICNACSASPIDLMFVIDSSVSVGEADFKLGLKFIDTFLEALQINTGSAMVQVAAIMFGERVYNEQAIYFNQHNSLQATRDAIMRLKWMHGTQTKTGPGIDFMTREFFPSGRPNAKKVGIVITDGESQDRRGTALAAKKARGKGVTMIAVGIGRARTEGGALSITELKNIAGKKSTVILADDYDHLQRYVQTLVRVTCKTRPCIITSTTVPPPVTIVKQQTCYGDVKMENCVCDCLDNVRSACDLDSEIMLLCKCKK